MFKSFFLDARWRLWSWAGTLLIFAASWMKAEIDVDINSWFGDFYNAIQSALSNPGSVTEKELLSHLLTFGKISVVFIAIAVFLEFFLRHYVFRWRIAASTGRHHALCKNC